MAQVHLERVSQTASLWVGLWMSLWMSLRVSPWVTQPESSLSPACVQPKCIAQAACERRGLSLGWRNGRKPGCHT